MAKTEEVQFVETEETKEVEEREPEIEVEADFTFARPLDIDNPDPEKSYAWVKTDNLKEKLRMGWERTSGDSGVMRNVDKKTAGRFIEVNELSLVEMPKRKHEAILNEPVKKADSLTRSIEGVYKNTGKTVGIETSGSIEFS